MSACERRSTGGLAVVGPGARVLVTGASGLVGSHVVDALREAGYRPRAFSRTPMPLDGTALDAVLGDVRDKRTLTGAIAGCEAVIHTAALYSYARKDAAAMDATNVEGTRNVLDVAAAAGVRRVVLTSSAATCGPVPRALAHERDQAPEWELRVPYKRTKLASERLALQRALAGEDIVVVNPTTVVGARDRRPTPSGKMVRDVLSGRIRGYLVSGGLNVVSAEDVAVGHVLALKHGRRGERYLLGGENIAMKELFRLIATLGGVHAPSIPVPRTLALAAAQSLDLVSRLSGNEPSLLQLDEVRLARLPMYFTSAKAEAELGYSACGADEALAPAVAWFAQHAPARRRFSLAVEPRPG